MPTYHTNVFIPTFLENWDFCQGKRGLEKFTQFFELFSNCFLYCPTNCISHCFLLRAQLLNKLFRGCLSRKSDSFYSRLLSHKKFQNFLNTLQLVSLNNLHQ